MAYEKAAAGYGAGTASGNTFTLDPDMLPPGMAGKVKVGDILEFKVAEEPDADGGVTVVYNTGEESGGGEEAMEAGAGAGEAPPEGGGEPTGSWEEDFRKSMSPQAPQTEEA